MDFLCFTINKENLQVICIRNMLKNKRGFGHGWNKGYC